ARPSLSVREVRARWLEMHRNWRALRRPPVAIKLRPRWGLVIEHLGSLEDLECTLGTARAQLREDLVAILVLRRGVAPLCELATTLVVDELTDTDAEEALSWLRGQGVNTLLVLRSGARVAPHSADLLSRGAASTAAVLLPAARIEADNTILPVIGSAALSQLEG